MSFFCSGDLQLVATMSASADVLALASAEFDISGIAEGTTITVKWRGKPVFVRHRTEAEIETENGVPLSSLKDAQADSERVTDPKWYVHLPPTHLPLTLQTST